MRRFNGWVAAALGVDFPIDWPYSQPVLKGSISGAGAPNYLNGAWEVFAVIV